MNLRLYLAAALLLATGAESRCRAAELPDYPDDEVAGIAVNYTEADAGGTDLPDPLVGDDGQPITTAEQWWSTRRGEIYAHFESNQFGRSPGEPTDVRYEVVEDRGAAFDGAAVRRQVAIHFGDGEDAPRVDVLIYTPSNAEGPAPALMSIGFTANNQAVDDPQVRTGRVWDRQAGKRVPADAASRFGRVPAKQIIESGFGLVRFCYGDIDVDAPGAAAHGVRAVYSDGDPLERQADEWGAIAAWAWGISRVVDYLQTDDLVDGERLALTGISRLGKTVLWAGASDQRIAAVIASCSGEGGAALSRRNYGETIAHLASPRRYEYQFARNYEKWGADPAAAPVDAHELIALVAPRPLLLQTGTGDKWSDPVGEFLAAKAATPVYGLLSKTGVEADSLPEAGQLIGGALGYYMHDGGHGMVAEDWPVYLKFLQQHL